MRRTERPDLALVEGAEQLSLAGRGRLSDFIEKQGAAACGLEQCLVVPRCPREGAFPVPDELAWKQRFANTAAVHGHKRLRASGAGGVDRPREELLAAAGRSLEEHNGRGVHGSLSEIHGPPDGFALPDDGLEALRPADGVALRDLMGERRDLLGIHRSSQRLPHPSGIVIAFSTDGHDAGCSSRRE